MKAAKADEDDFKRVRKFFNPLEALFDNRHGCCHEDDWRDWNNDDEDKKELLEIEKRVIEEDGEDIWGHADDRLILYEFIKRRFQEAEYAGGFGRVIMNAEVLVEQVCDPDKDYLDFNPDIKRALEEYNERHKDDEEEKEETENQE